MPARKSRRTDVLIVGSGAVGVAAGLEAHEAGAQVVVLEKEAHLGGAAAISGGGCSCVGTRLQREHGIEDAPDLALLGPALFSGRVAGAWAACEAGYGKGFVGKADYR